jgi:hypothetical protein
MNNDGASEHAIHEVESDNIFMNRLQRSFISRAIDSRDPIAAS